MDPTLAAKIARREAVVRSLQELLVERQQLAQAPADLDPDALLVGGGLDLDSLDVLTLVVGVEQVFHLRIETEAAARPALRTLNTLADLILSAQGDAP